MQGQTRLPKTEYQRYIVSAKWRAFAADAKLASGWRCQRCDRASRHLQAHHLTYERLGNEKATDLWIVCGRCHRALHGLLKPKRRKPPPPKKAKSKKKRTQTERDQAHQAFQQWAMARQAETLQRREREGSPKGEATWVRRGGYSPGFRYRCEGGGEPIAPPKGKVRRIPKDGA